MHLKKPESNIDTYEGVDINNLSHEKTLEALKFAINEIKRLESEINRYKYLNNKDMYRYPYPLPYRLGDGLGESDNKYVAT